MSDHLSSDFDLPRPLTPEDLEENRDMRRRTRLPLQVGQRIACAGNATMGIDSGVTLYAEKATIKTGIWGEKLEHYDAAGEKVSGRDIAPKSTTRKVRVWSINPASQRPSTSPPANPAPLTSIPSSR